MKFNPRKVGFGRHETFPLRYSWLIKGFQALLDNPGVFSSEDATVTLGVGRNMVHAIRFWLLAARLMQHCPEGFQPTILGEMVFGAKGFDPYLEDEATLWLIHWLIVNVMSLWLWSRTTSTGWGPSCANRKNNAGVGNEDRTKKRPERTQLPTENSRERCA